MKAAEQELPILVSLFWLGKSDSQPPSHCRLSWYMSPEQILTPTTITHRSDVYSAGIVLYEMLPGMCPLDGESDFTIQNKQVKEPVPDPAKRDTFCYAGAQKNHDESAGKRSG